MARRCKHSWLDTYLEYTHTQESPTAFHEWVGLALLSTALGRHIWIPRIKYTIFPNLFIILVAGSAKCRKSVSVNIGIDVLRNIKHPPMIFAQKITTEALIQALETAKIDGASSGLICASELSVFMGADSARSGIIPALTDLYDSPKEWVYHTRGRGKEVLRNVTLTILAASTQEWLRSSITPDAVGGGFTSRIVFVYQERPARSILFPQNDEAEQVLRGDLIADLSEIRASIRGPITFTPSAMKAAEEWYDTEFQQTHSSKLSGYYARKHDTMFKLAAILSASECSTKVIDHTHIHRALGLLAENEKNLESVIAGIVTTAVGEEIGKVLSIVKRYRKIAHSDLLRHSWRFATSEQVSTMLRTLIESKEITEIIDGRKRFYEINVRR